MLRPISSRLSGIGRRYFSSNHPNITVAAQKHVTDFPHRKTNTVINFGRQGRQYVIERFGKYHRKSQPGVFLTIPFAEKIIEVDLRQEVIDVNKQKAYTSDNVAVEAAAQLYITVVDVEKTCYKVSQPLVAVVSQAQSALRTAIGKNDLDHLLKDRNSINNSVLQDLQHSVEQWGITVSRFEITELTPDQQIQKAMDLQSTAERARRAAVTEAEGKKRAAELEAEGKKNAVELEAAAKKKAMELEAEGTANAAKFLSSLPRHVLEYWIQNRHIQMMGAVAEKGKHSSFFLGKDMSTLPVWGDLFTQKEGPTILRGPYGNN